MSHKDNVLVLLWNSSAFMEDTQSVLDTSNGFTPWKLLYQSNGYRCPYAGMVQLLTLDKLQLKEYVSSAVLTAVFSGIGQ